MLKIAIIVLIVILGLEAYDILNDVFSFTIGRYIGIVRIFSTIALSVCITYNQIKNSKIITGALWFVLGFAIYMVMFAFEENLLLYLMHIANMNEPFEPYIPFIKDFIIWGVFFSSSLSLVLLLNKSWKKSE